MSLFLITYSGTFLNNECVFKIALKMSPCQKAWITSKYSLSKWRVFFFLSVSRGLSQEQCLCVPCCINLFTRRWGSFQTHNRGGNINNSCVGEHHLVQVLDVSLAKNRALRCRFLCPVDSRGPKTLSGQQHPQLSLMFIYIWMPITFFCTDRLSDPVQTCEQTCSLWRSKCTGLFGNLLF